MTTLLAGPGYAPIGHTVGQSSGPWPRSRFGGGGLGTATKGIYVPLMKPSSLLVPTGLAIAFLPFIAQDTAFAATYEVASVADLQSAIGVAVAGDTIVVK